MVRDDRPPKRPHLSRVDLNVTTDQPQMDSGQSTVSRWGGGEVISEDLNDFVVVG